MKRILLLLMVVAVVYSCQQVARKQQEITGPVKFSSVDSLLAHAAVNADSMVIVKGMVSSVCPQGGLHCMLKGISGDVTLMVKAGKETGPFGQELVGSNLEVTGILRAASLHGGCLAGKDSLMKECPEGIDLGAVGLRCEEKCKHAVQAAAGEKMPCDKMKGQEAVPAQEKTASWFLEGLSFVKDTLP